VSPRQTRARSAEEERAWEGETGRAGPHSPVVPNALCGPRPVCDAAVSNSCWYFRRVRCQYSREREFMGRLFFKGCKTESWWALPAPADPAVSQAASHSCPAVPGIRPWPTNTNRDRWQTCNAAVSRCYPPRVPEVGVFAWLLCRTPSPAWAIPLWKTGS